MNFCQSVLEKDYGATGIGATGLKSAFERASERVSEREGFQRFLEVFRCFQRPSQSPSQSAISLSELWVLLPLIVLPLKTPVVILAGGGEELFWGLGVSSCAAEVALQHP